jgi:hypothetical protein
MDRIWRIALAVMRQGVFRCPVSLFRLKYRIVSMEGLAAFAAVKFQKMQVDEHQ